MATEQDSSGSGRWKLAALSQTVEKCFVEITAAESRLERTYGSRDGERKPELQTVVRSKIRDSER